MDYDLEAFGNRLLRARLGIGLSQREFAEAIGASVGSIPGYENGKNDPRMSLSKKMADVLGVSVAWLISGEDVVDFGTDPEKAKKIREYILFLNSQDNSL